MEKRKGIIYVYFNRAKYEQERIERYYVGQTVRTMEQRAGKDGSGYRWKDENCESSFARAIRKWGWDSFEYRVLEEVYEEDLNELEIFYIKQFDSYNNGYNDTLGGDGARGHNPFENKNEEEMEEISKKMSESQKGKKLSYEHKQKISESNKGKKLSIETRKKMSENRKGKKLSIETRQKVSKSNKGKKRSSETKQKISESKKGKISQAKQVYCIELNIKFLYIRQAEKYCKNKLYIKIGPISKVCKGKRNYAGILQNGTKLTWKYVEDVDPDILKNAIICDYEE